MPLALQGLFSSIAASTGLVFNGYILVVLLWQRRIQTANNLLLLHLAFVDTIFCLVILTGNAAWGIAAAEASVTGLPDTPQYVPGGACEVHGYAWNVLPVIVMWTVCGLSCDRYAAISTPLHYSRLVNTRRAMAFIALVWLLGSALAVPPLFDVCSYSFCEASLSCLANCTRATHTDMGYAFAYVGIAVVLPLVVVLVCNLHILTIARYHRHRIVSAIYQVTLSAQATVTHQRNPFYLSKFKGKNAILTILQLVGSLLTLAAPYFGIIVWEATTGSPADPLYVAVTSVLFTWTPPVNAYVYGVKSRVLRQTFKSLLQRHLSKREAIRAVESRVSVNPPNPRRPLSRRCSAPAGYFGWESCSTFGVTRHSPISGSLRVPRESSNRRTKAFHRRPSFMVEIGSTASQFLQEVAATTSNQFGSLNRLDLDRDIKPVERPEVLISLPSYTPDCKDKVIGENGVEKCWPEVVELNSEPPKRGSRRKYGISPSRTILPDIKEAMDDTELESTLKDKQTDGLLVAEFVA